MRRVRVRAGAQPLVHWAWRQMTEAGKITSGSRAARRFGFFGEGSAIAFPQGTLLGERWISVGHFTLIGPHATVSAGFVPERDLGPEPIVRIGNGVVLGRGSHVVGHQSIDIGDDVYTGPYIYITDQNHGYADPDTPIGKQWPVNKPVTVGAGSWIGAGAVILPGARIGRNVVVAAGAVVRGEVPDHCVVAGAPARVVRRLDADGRWHSIRAESELAGLYALPGGGPTKDPMWDPLGAAVLNGEAGAKRRGDSGAVLGGEPPAGG
jgi:carbonic anhydrase/acetyltransferase-like protein (isoleucine patch superfamily)